MTFTQPEPPKRILRLTKSDFTDLDGHTHMTKDQQTKFITRRLEQEGFDLNAPISREPGVPGEMIFSQEQHGE